MFFFCCVSDTFTDVVGNTSLFEKLFVDFPTLCCYNYTSDMPCGRPCLFHRAENEQSLPVGIIDSGGLYMAFLSLHNVKKEYHTGTVTVHAPEDVSFDANEGEFVVILGASGAGKTTLQPARRHGYGDSRQD